MAYTVINFKTKNELKNEVNRWNNKVAKLGFNPVIQKPVKCFNPGLGPDLSNFTGKICLEGPHYPAAHTWYAEAELKDGIVIKVK
jgi:hypothetical protein